MKHGLILVLTLLSFIVSTSTYATLYKSVDADGNVSYSQTPPKSGNYEKIKVQKFKPVPAAEAAKKSQAAKETFEKGKQARNEDDLLKIEKDKNKKIQQENCEIAKKNLRLFTIFKRLKNEKGEYYRVSDTEREQRIKAAEGNIKQYCK
ncbi:MAG: DUF4124 domain-containing protein [Gammaproteobacteria bacterium]